MQKSQNLQLGSLEIKNITQRKVAILGGTGSGKTSTLKMIAAVASQQDIRHDSLPTDVKLPVYIFDPLNVIYIKGFDRVVFGKGAKENGEDAGKLFSGMKPRNMIFAFKDLY